MVVEHQNSIERARALELENSRLRARTVELENQLCTGMVRLLGSRL